MAYYYNGAKILAPLSITSNEPVYDVDTVSLSKQRTTQGAQRWELAFKTATSDATEADMLVGVVDSITSAETMTMPQLPSVVKANTSSAVLPINADASGGASTVTVVSDGVISKGSFIKFSNHDKIYMVTAGVAASTTPANTVLTGSIDPTASVNVVGVGTLFNTELTVGDEILVSGETRTVATITDDLNLTVTVAFTDTANDTSPELVSTPTPVSVSIYPSLRSAVTTLDTLYTSNASASAVSISYYRDVSNLRGLTFTDGILSSTGTVNLVEALV